MLETVNVDFKILVTDQHIEKITNIMFLSPISLLLKW